MYLLATIATNLDSAQPVRAFAPRGAGFLRPGFGIFAGVRLDVGGSPWAKPPILTKTAGER
jgi:hypothetical protein